MKHTKYFYLNAVRIDGVRFGVFFSSRSSRNDAKIEVHFRLKHSILYHKKKKKLFYIYFPAVCKLSNKRIGTDAGLQ